MCDSRGPDCPGFYKEGNRRDSPGYIVAVEDGVQLGGQGVFNMGLSRRSCIGPFRH